MERTIDTRTMYESVLVCKCTNFYYDNSKSIAVLNEWQGRIELHTDIHAADVNIVSQSSSGIMFSYHEPCTTIQFESKYYQ